MRTYVAVIGIPRNDVDQFALIPVPRESAYFFLVFFHSETPWKMGVILRAIEREQGCTEKSDWFKMQKFLSF